MWGVDRGAVQAGAGGLIVQARQAVRVLYQTHEDALQHILRVFETAGYLDGRLPASGRVGMGIYW